VPAFEETRDCEHAQDWLDMASFAMSFRAWRELMGPSVHAAMVNGKLVPKYKANAA
jgi:hypothetical protein